MRWNRFVRREKGAVLITVALFLLVMLAFTALGVEAGRWYLVRAELSKSVDAGALAGARNISNPNVDPRELAKDFTAENFPNGYLGTPASGDGSANFNVTLSEGGKIDVRGTTIGSSVFGKVVGFEDVPVSSNGVAQKQEVEIILILDRSGSMSGQPIADLKVASKSFIDFFADTQAEDRIGLVSFSTSARLDRALGNNFVAPIKTAIDQMNAANFTNAADAIDQADGPGGLTDQSAVPPERRRQQFVIFFSDGRPTALRSRFKYRGNWIDAVATGSGNCETGSGPRVNSGLTNPVTGAAISIDARVTGDGLAIGSRCGATGRSVRWELFDYRPVPGYAPDHCSIPGSELGQHFCNMTSALAEYQAGVLKDKNITIYAIGLGNIHPEFLESLASSSNHVYYTPNSDELKAIFQKVAMEIKLRLVQ